MKFKSAKNSFITVVIWATITFLGCVLFVSVYKQPFFTHIISFITTLFCILFLLSIWFFTFYEIKNNRIYYQSSFIKGSIPVKGIVKIELNKTMWVGLRLALATKGMIIHYNKYDTIYISPKEKEKFCEELLTLNPDIVVVER